MRILVTLLITCLLSYSGIAQTGIISGTVTEEGGKGVPSVTVSLLKEENNALTKVALTDKEGRYEFAGIKEGHYRIMITSVGYAKDTTKSFAVTAGASIAIPAINIHEVAKGLTGVTVESKRAFIETKIDKTIVNVDASPTNAGATALEVLEKSPGVMVNNEGAISLRGKQGVIIMVDGKQTFLSAADLATMLKNMPASALDQIEIMTNPSAKWDASGNSGVINIKTKKGKNDGFNGSIMIGATTSIYKLDGDLLFLPKSSNSFTFNYRKNKVNLFGNYNPNFNKGRNVLNLNRNFYDNAGTFDGSAGQITHFKFSGTNHSLKLGLDYYADKKNIVGVVFTGFLFSGNPRPQTVTHLRDANGETTSSLISTTDNKGRFKNLTGNLNWKHTFDTTGKELTVDYDYVTYSNLSDMLLTADNFSSTGRQMGLTSFLRGHLPSSIDIHSFKSDYIKPFKNGRFEGGIKSSFVTTDNKVDYTRLAIDKWITDARSNHFIYHENINAAYINSNKQFKKWTVQAGLRVENTIADGNQITSNQTFKRDTTNFFPTAFVSYDVNKTNKLTVSYGKRINRPNYQNLNPFVFFLDSLTYQQGNPNLKPQYTHNIEVSHAFKGKFITTVSYNNTTDVISQMLKQNTAEKKTFMTFENVANLENISLSLTIPLTLTKWWNANLFTNVYNNHYEGMYNNSPIDIQATSFMMNMTNTFTINKAKGLTGEVSGFYRHRSIDQLTIFEPVYQISLGAQKGVLKGKGTVRLNVRDPFAWQKFRGHSRYDDIDTKIYVRPDIRQVTATFTYRFGKNTPGSQPRRRNTSSQDEQSRVGQGGQ